MSAPGQRARGEAVLLALTATWGTTFVAIQGVLPAWPPMWLMAVRFGLAAAVLLPATLALPGVAAAAPAAPRRAPLPWREGSILGLWAFGGYGLQTLSLQHTSAAHAAFGTAMVTIIVPLLACVVDRRPWRASTALALLAAGGGMGLLLGQPGAAAGRLGDLLALGAAIAFSWQVLLLERYMRAHGALALVAIELAVTAALSGGAALGRGEAWPRGPDVGWPVVVYLGLVATALCMLGQGWGQARTSATRAAFIYALEPIFAAMFGWAVRGDLLSPPECVGGALIVGAAVIADRPTPWGQGRARR